MKEKEITKWKDVVRSSEPQFRAIPLGPGMVLTWAKMYAFAGGYVIKYENGQNEARIENNFKYHPPKHDQNERYELIRSEARKLAYLLNNVTPYSREQSLAFTDLEDFVMHANAAIARNE